MRIRVVDGDVLRIRCDGGEYLDNVQENKLFEFLQARQLDRSTTPREVILQTRKWA